MLWRKGVAHIWRASECQKNMGRTKARDKARHIDRTKRIPSDVATLRAKIVSSWLKNHYSYKAAAEECMVNRGKVWYWVQKFFNDNFHGGKHGGDRRSIFSGEQKQALQKLLLIFLQEEPEANARTVHDWICFLMEGMLVS